MVIVRFSPCTTTNLNCKKLLEKTYDVYFNGSLVSLFQNTVTEILIHVSALVLRLTFVPLAFVLTGVARNYHVPTRVI